METWGCCEPIMMGYLSINPNLWANEDWMHCVGLLFRPKLCLYTRLLGRAQFKLWGVKKNSVPYMTEIVITNVYLTIIEKNHLEL